MKLIGLSVKQASQQSGIPYRTLQRYVASGKVPTLPNTKPPKLPHDFEDALDKWKGKRTYHNYCRTCTCDKIKSPD